MSQRQYRRVEKNQSQVHHKPRRSGGRGCPNSAAQPHYQWISSAGGRGRGRGSGGGGEDSAGVPPLRPCTPSRPHSSSIERYKKPTGQGGKSRGTVAAVSSESTIEEKTSSTRSGFSEAFDSSASEAPSKSTLPIWRKDGESISKAASSKSPSKTTYSAAATTSLRGESSHGVSLQTGSLNPGFENEIQAPLKSFKRETNESASSMSRMQKPKEDMEQSNSEISHHHSKAKRDAHSPHSFSTQKKYNSFKPEATLSTSSMHGKQHVEYVEKSKNETLQLQSEAKREIHVQVASVAPAVNSTQDISLSVPGVSVATSSFQQPNFQLQFGMSSLPQTWSQGIASASVQIPVQSSVGDFSQFQESTYFPSFQPYTLQPQDVMHYGQGLNLSTAVGHQFGSQFANFNGIPPLHLHVQNDVRNANPRISIKITHPETKEELKLEELAKPKLDSGSSTTRAHINMPLQAQPLAYGPSHLMNYFSHMQPKLFFLHNPMSVTFSSTQMFPTSTKSQLKYLEYGTDIHGAVAGSNSERASSASIPTSSRPAFSSVRGNFLSPTLVNPKSETIRSTRPQRVGSRQGKSNIHLEISVKHPPKVVIKPEVSVVSSSRAITSAASVEGGLSRESKNGDGKTSVAIGDSDNLSKPEEIKMCEQPVVDNICEEQNVNKLRLPETSEQMELGELKDWQKVAEISTPELHISRRVEVHQNMGNAAADSFVVPGKKRYSRDFLLTLSSQSVEVPTDFELSGDMIKEILVSEVPNDQRYRVADGSMWIKTSPPSASEREQQFEICRGNFGVHSSQGGTCGSNLHGLTPDHVDGGLVTVSLPPTTSRFGRRNKGPDVDRWRQGTFLNKGLISLPQSPLQVMHKAEKKYKLHKVIDGEEAMQRKLKAILNKLTPQNFERLFQQVKEVNIDNTITLSGLISQIFDKALMEPTFCEMYANFCYHLSRELPNFDEGHEKITFKRLLLNKCQEEFVRGEREQAEANIIEEDGKARLSEKREEHTIRARRRMLGNIRLIGELYKKKMLTERVMHDCIQKLLGNNDYPDEEDVEALCKLMITVGEIIDHPRAKEQINSYFEVMKNLSNNTELSSRMRFMLKDVIDLRKNKWQQRRKVEGPKKIEELHIDAAQERRALVSQLTCGSNVISSNKKVSTNFSPRLSNLQSPQNSRAGIFRAMPPHVYGFASQDVRLEDKHLHKQGTVSVPFPHRLSDENTMSPGVQVGQAKTISVRGPPMAYGSLLTDSHTDFGDSRRIPASLNGKSSISEQKQYNMKQHPMPRYANDTFKLASGYDHPIKQRNIHSVNKDLTSTNSGEFIAAPLKNHIKPTLPSNVSSRNVWSEECLRETSVAVIREFYSARDENEVNLHVRDLNTPMLHPLMISTWINDSFVRKDGDRDLFVGLLVNLTKSKTGVFKASQLIEGFELVLATLEDIVTDAPKAAVFLGQLIGRIIVANVLSLREIKRLIQERGKESGHLLKIGLGYQVVESAFETIRSEWGEHMLQEICRLSHVHLDDFRPSDCLE